MAGGPLALRGWMTLHADATALNGLQAGDFLLQPVAGDDLMVVRVTGPRGALAPRHSHPHEQMCVIVSGRVRFEIDDQQIDATSGSVVHIPCGVEHAAEALEDTEFYDIFHPVRQDFLDALHTAGE